MHRHVDFEVDCIAVFLQKMRAFWMPLDTQEAQRLLEKQDMNTYCPVTGKTLPSKDLIPIRALAMHRG